MTTGSISRTSPDGLSSFTKTWTGTDGKTVENPYSVDMLTINRKKGEYYSQIWEAGKIFIRTRSPSNDYCYFNSGMPVLAATGNQDLEALAKIATAIRGHDFNLAVFGAEARQTLELLTNTSKQVLVMAKLLRQADWKGALLALRLAPGQQTIKKFRKKVEAGDFSGALLAIRYGWEPLLQDLYQMMLAVQARGKERGVTFRGRSTVKRAYQFIDNDPAWPVPGQQTCTVSYKVIWKEQLSTARSLGLLDPATVAWEKLPWSFVVDWFIPISTYLADLSFFGGTSCTATKTVFCQSDAAVVNWSGPIPPTLPAVGRDAVENMTFIGKRIVMTRTVGPITLPKPNFKSLDKALSLTHLENAAALIHQLVIGANPTKYAGRH